MTHDRNRAPADTTTGAGTREFPAGHADHVVTPGDSIQAAVDDASAGDVIGVEPGTYTEQVVLDEQVTLAGAGRGETTVRSPESLDASFTRDGDEFHPVVFAERDGATVGDLTVDGNRRGDGNEAFVGVGGHDVSLRLDGVEVRDVAESSPDGTRHGFGVLVYVDDGARHEVAIERCEVHGYQRGGIVGDGDGLTIYVEETNVTGRNSTAPVRQNGVQVSDVDRATVVGCTITDNYHAETTLASGIAAIDSSDIFVAWNRIERNDVGITARETDDAVVRRNNVHTNGMGVLNLGSAAFDATNNWWGADDGPSPPSVEAGGTSAAESAPTPDGSGDVVYNVEWQPCSEERFDLHPSVHGGRGARPADDADADPHGRQDIR